MEPIVVFREHIANDVRDPNNIITIKSKFFNNMKLFSPTNTFREVMNIWSPRFDTSSVGIDLFKNFDKLLFIDCWVNLGLQAYAFYQYESNSFAILNREDGIIKRRSQNFAFYDQFFNLDIIPVVVDNPVSILNFCKLGKVTHNARLCFTYEMWLKTLQSEPSYRKTYETIYKKYCVNRAWRFNNQNLSLYCVSYEGVYVLLDTFDIMYLNTAGTTLDNGDITKICHMGPLKMLPYIKEWLANMGHIDKDILEFSTEVRCIAAMLGGTNLNGLCCIDRLYYDSSSQTFTEDGGIEFRVGKKYQRIKIYSDYIKIGKKKYVMDIDMLNLFLIDFCKEEAKENWVRYPIDKNSKEGIDMGEEYLNKYNTLSKEKAEELKEKEAIAKEVAIDIDIETQKELASYNDTEKVDEMFKYDSDAYTRICIIREFNKHIGSVYNDYFGMKSINGQLEEYISKIKDVSLDTYKRICKANIVDNDKGWQVVNNLERKFMEWCSEIYGIVMVKDIKLYTSKHVNTENISDICTIAMDIMKFRDNGKMKLSNLIETQLSNTVEKAHVIYNGYIYITDLHYAVVTANLDPYNKNGLFIAQVYCDKPSDYIFFVAPIQKILDLVATKSNVLIEVNNNDSAILPDTTITEFSLISDDPDKVYEAKCNEIFDQFVAMFNQKFILNPSKFV